MSTLAYWLLGILPLALLEAARPEPLLAGGSLGAATGCALLALLAHTLGARIFPKASHGSWLGAGLGLSFTCLFISLLWGAPGFPFGLLLLIAGSWWGSKLLHGIQPSRFSGIIAGTAWILMFFSITRADSLGNRNPALKLGEAQAQQQPDIVLLVLDTLRADVFAPHGDQPSPMPQLQAFAERCRKYERGYAVANFTPPGHSGLFTGLFPSETRTLKPGHVRLPLSTTTLAEFLEELGWNTLGVNSNLRIEGRAGFAQGFQTWDESLVREQSPVIRPLLKLAHGHVVSVALGKKASMALGARLRTFFLQKQIQVTATQTTGRTIQLLNETPKEEPLFLFVNYYDPHLPYTAPQADREAWGAGHPSERFENSHDDLLDTHRKIRDITESSLHGATLPHPDVLHLEEAYWEQCLELDRGVTSLLQALERRGNLDNTLLLITSDHGEHLGEHNLFLHGTSLFEEQVHVPFLLYGPNIEPGISQQMVSGVDFFPTVCEAIGVPMPSDLRGISLLEHDSQPRLIRFESGNRRGWIIGNHKWIMEETSSGLVPTGAYDLATDPEELHDLSESALDWVHTGFQNPPFHAVGKSQASSSSLLDMLGYSEG